MFSKPFLMTCYTDIFVSLYKKDNIIENRFLHFVYWTQILKIVKQDEANLRLKLFNAFAMILKLRLPFYYEFITEGTKRHCHYLSSYRIQKEIFVLCPLFLLIYLKRKGMYIMFTSLHAHSIWTFQLLWCFICVYLKWNQR